MKKLNKPSPRHPRLKWYALLTLVLIALLGLYLTLRMYRVISPISIIVSDPLTSFAKSISRMDRNRSYMDHMDHNLRLLPICRRVSPS